MDQNVLTKIQNKITYVANQLFKNDDYGKADAYNDLDDLVNKLSKRTHITNHIMPKPFEITLAQPVDVGDILFTTDDNGKPRKIQVTKVNGIHASAIYVNC